MPSLTCTVTQEKWPIDGSFRISRGRKTDAEVVIVTLSDGALVGRGEAVPYGRYGESVSSVMREIKAIIPQVEAGLDRAALLTRLPAGAARAAIDGALWDLEAKRFDRPVFDLAGMGALQPVLTCYTISLDEPDKMAAAALDAQNHPLLKLKLGGGSDHEAMRSVRCALPAHRLVVDANEAWGEDTLPSLIETAHDCNIELVEQPLPAGQDDFLHDFSSPVPLCADESFHTLDDLEAIALKYQAINIKIDKTGGLTHALEVLVAARLHDLKLMVGCMVSTSLAMAPAFVLTPCADWVDLDGPLLLAKDRDHGLVANEGLLSPPSRLLWG